MAQELELEPEDRLLEVGAGSGYATAVCSRIVAQVFAIEDHQRLADLARERAVLLGDGNRGWPAATTSKPCCRRNSTSTSGSTKHGPWRQSSRRICKAWTRSTRCDDPCAGRQATQVTCASAATGIG